MKGLGKKWYKKIGFLQQKARVNADMCLVIINVCVSTDFDLYETCKLKFASFLFLIHLWYQGKFCLAL